MQHEADAMRWTALEYISRNQTRITHSFLFDINLYTIFIFLLLRSAGRPFTKSILWIARRCHRLPVSRNACYVQQLDSDDSRYHTRAVFANIFRFKVSGCAKYVVDMMPFLFGGGLCDGCGAAFRRGWNSRTGLLFVHATFNEGGFVNVENWTQVQPHISFNAAQIIIMMRAMGMLQTRVAALTSSLIFNG